MAEAKTVALDGVTFDLRVWRPTNRNTKEEMIYISVVAEDQVTKQMAYTGIRQLDDASDPR